jgi:hypothetical protein
VVVASSRSFSVEISFDFVTGSKWANHEPQRRVRNTAGLASLHDVLWDFTRTRQPSQSILFSIYGYSLALDAESKDFQI